MSEVVIGNKGSGKAPRKTYKQKKAARQDRKSTRLNSSH